jgi:cell division protein FtsB
LKYRTAAKEAEAKVSALTDRVNELEAEVATLRGKPV